LLEKLEKAAPSINRSRAANHLHARFLPNDFRIALLQGRFIGIVHDRLVEQAASHCDVTWITWLRAIHREYRQIDHRTKRSD
jgi:hypothetical protein